MREIRSFGLLLLSIFLVLSCQKEPFVNYGSELDKDDNMHFVSEEKAKSIAVLKSIYKGSVKKMSGISGMSMTQEKNEPKKIKDIFQVDKDTGTPSFYIVNYANQGFIIIAADDRAYPILAYSDNGNFPVNPNQQYPRGLVSWLEQTDRHIRDIRLANESRDVGIANAWKELELMEKDNMGLLSTSDFPPCVVDGTEYIDIKTYGPYLETEWGQGVGYNNNSPDMGCAFYSNGRAPTGCVATAVAQIMAYHQHPSSYSWTSMPNNTGSAATSTLMRDIGNAVDMDYGCNGSGAKTKDAAPALRNIFKYSSAAFGDYDAATVLTNIKNQRPVILSGGRKDKWWFFNVYADGHAWVCEGATIMTTYKCEIGDPELHPGGEFWSKWKYYRDTVLFYMNWGWGGTFNGNYYTDNFNPGDNTYNYKTHMIVNIQP